jgi:flagella basal body P-ring formation protein FlgA
VKVTALALSLLQAAATVVVAADASELDASLRTHLRERYPLVERWEIHPIAHAKRPATGEAHVVRLGSRSAIRVGTQVYWYSVAGFQSAIHASRSVQSGEALDPSAGRPEETDVLGAACNPLTDVSHLTGMRARRAFREGQLVCSDGIEPRPPVARGDEVTVRYVGTRISLTTKGIAAADGALGERVNVKKMDTPDVYRAVVSGMREVTIHE